MHQDFQGYITLQKKFYATRKAQLSSSSNRTENATYESYDKALQSGFETKWRDIQAAQEPLVPIRKPNPETLQVNLKFGFEFFFLEIAFICLFLISLFHVSVLRCLLILWFRMRNLKADVTVLSTLSFTLGWSGGICLGSHSVCTCKASLGLIEFPQRVMLQFLPGKVWLSSYGYWDPAFNMNMIAVHNVSSAVPVSF